MGKAVLRAMHDLCRLVFLKNVIIAQRARVAAVAIGNDQLILFKGFVFLDTFEQPPERIRPVAVRDHDRRAPAPPKRNADAEAARKRPCRRCARLPRCGKIGIHRRNACRGRNLFRAFSPRAEDARDMPNMARMRGTAERIIIFHSRKTLPLLRNIQAACAHIEPMRYRDRPPQHIIGKLRQFGVFRLAERVGAGTVRQAHILIRVQQFSRRVRIVCFREAKQRIRGKHVALGQKDDEVKRLLPAARKRPVRVALCLKRCTRAHRKRLLFLRKQPDEEFRHEVQLRVPLCRKRLIIRRVAREKRAAILLRRIADGGRLPLRYGGEQRRDRILCFAHAHILASRSAAYAAERNA